MRKEGLERCKALKAQIEKRMRWTPLDPQNQTIHLSKVEVDNDVVYSEIR